ncbi:MAG: TIGR03118 family protein, partial [Candidatus Eisenbacteria bacterium]|nr:TIGR03118 family protein [Candidatus Eisenbacteria bacterium]
VDQFGYDGSFQRRLVTGGHLDSPWGAVIAPAGFGDFAGDLLVANSGDGVINAFDFGTGAFVGTLRDEIGAPLTIPGLKGLAFGTGGLGGDPNTLYFAAGIPGSGGIGDHGLMGSIQWVDGSASVEGRDRRSELLLRSGPVPARGTVRTSFDLPTGGVVRLGLFDVTGREVAVLTDRSFEAGRHEIRWNTRALGLPSGAYLLSLSGPAGNATARIPILQ